MKLLTINVNLLVLAVMLLFCTTTTAEEIRVAVASNFTATMTLIAKHFETNTGHKVKLSFGSTGKHYAQIKNGAPFDLFFSGDVRRPERLENEGIAQPNSRHTYAIGRLVLWSPRLDFVDANGYILKQEKKFRYLAIANPKLAPYGKAAQEVLQKQRLWDVVRGKLVRGENIGQTYLFVKSGNAELGFVALSQLKRFNQAIEGSYWIIPSSLYTPIKQQAVLLRDNQVAREFLAFVRGAKGLAIIKEHGYETP